MSCVSSVSILRKQCHNQGFALVIALSLMAFVLLLILSISTLVQVEITSANTSAARIKAEQAALLSLNMAIGKLQETAGLDQRVTAPAESAGRTEVGAKQLTGVWRSWEGRDHQDNGVPVAPDYASKQVEGDQEIASTTAGRFLGWLVSSAYDPDITPSVAFDSPPSLTEVSGQTVALVGEGSVGSDADGIANQVHVEPTSFDDGEGAYAWWISGENTKALLDVPEVSSDIFDWGERLASSTIPDESVFEITDADDLDKVIDRDSLNLIPNDVTSDQTLSGKYFHDVTGYARGLLTNTATGGWRRDLSLMSEQWDYSGFPTSDLPFFTLQPGVETSAGKASVNGASSAGNLIYPWSVESTFAANGGDTNNTLVAGPSVSWDALVDFAQQYRKITAIDSSGRVSMPLESVNARDEIPRRPVLARIHWVFSFMSRADTNDSDQYQAYILASPVLTLWNPYNVAIPGYDQFSIRFLNPVIPVKFQFTVGGVTQSDFYGIDQFAGNNRINFIVSADDSEWAPGESRVYSATSVGGDEDDKIDLALGYRTDGGARYALYKTYTSRGVSSGGELTAGADDSFTVALQKEDDTAFQVEILTPNPEAQMELLYSVPKESSDLYYSDADLTPVNNDITLGDVEETLEFPEPFLVAIMQLRNSTVRSTDAKGYFHAKPNNFFTSDEYDYLDAYPYDWVFFTPTDTNDSESFPQAGGSSDSSGYVGTSFRADVGLSNFVIYEIPTRPLRSMGELQHFDVNYYSPLPPFIANPIGNSHASYLIEPDAVRIAGSEADDVRATHDHSYVANHLLFDDWFVSSIAPEMVEGSIVLARETQEVYEDFLSGESELPNQAYVPAATVTAADASQTLLEDVNAWYDVASMIEVNGMFNINSTSVAAWTALLGHLNGGDVPYVSLSEDDWSVQLDSGSDDTHPVSRTTVAGDPSANPNLNISEIATHMRLSQEQVEELAARIVEQVKLRGPFLSLSEFVNRQLTSSDAELSRAGAIETALIELSELGSSAENPYSELQDTFLNSDTGAVDTVNVLSSPAFPEAAAGNTSYGFPGWVRQADVLRPIAPVLSARDDTFVIRAYGESKDPITGNTSASAWCEAVVQRRAEYVDTADEATALPSDTTLSSEVNKRFGRRFSIVSFRWLSPDEV
jgi:hypothetical protein